MPQRLISFDTEEWLEQRREVITATEIARAIRSPKYARELREEKRTGKQNFTGNRYTEWGKEREPVIAKHVRLEIDSSLEANDDLWVDDAGLIGATPDMVDRDWREGQPMELIGEIKTVGAHRDWGDGDIPAVYYDQVQVQLYVTDADECLFAWEPYVIEGEEFKPGEVRSCVIRRNEKRIKELVDFAHKWLEGKNPERPDVSFELAQIKKLTDMKAGIEAEINELRAQIMHAIGDEPGSWEYPSIGLVTMTKPSVRKTFDSKRFRKDHADLADEYTVEKETKPSLRLTFEKEHNND
ncbi:YqaJ viral recombinase family protein [Corynebacterium jeikeium]|uniref:YqaJ viral recombinase family protein n=1 Tax=Corynebacterium jeikeium TaxID=38289 RepID=UPI0001B7151D|nr:YqaJ viral recombinase family protein [Corynebacterium jeikeium]EEW17417.1 YqaJ viral recombinase family protein [Corynebacterium jeikeium ATCC 43734]OOD32502.1 hypothetical protein BWP03_03915 [Corynebacterium jeikeium]WCZ54162.1 YqaJ-like viral recombinase domain protein [Corynebacterium jeikeium]SUY80532.1 putative phage-type endonuclease [Corynebacterium jeikeium]